MSQSSISSNWREILQQNFTDWKKLVNYLELTDQQQTLILKQPNFSLNLPLRLAQKIEKKTLNDPILKQFLPLLEETKPQLNFIDDPVGDQACRLESKLLHKYKGRVLLLCTSSCAMHCRFCFRQNFNYEVNNKLFDKELILIEQDPSIREVILSGGDPLSLSNQKLHVLLEQLSLIPHITRIRFHTRFPIGIPERIEPEFLNILSAIPKQMWFVIHVNHPKELDREVLTRLRMLQKLGITILSHTVLLHQVNDDLDTLKNLFELLADNGIVPYYLHQLDRVKGSAHFEVEKAKGLALIEQLENELSGYAVPKYVCEIAGEPSKTRITDV